MQITLKAKIKLYKELEEGQNKLLNKLITFVHNESNDDVSEKLKGIFEKGRIKEAIRRRQENLKLPFDDELNKKISVISKPNQHSKPKNHKPKTRNKKHAQHIQHRSK